MDNEGFETFFKKNYDKAFYLAYRITHDDKTSQDIVSDAFELVWKTAHTRNVSNAPSYLFTTVRHLCTDYLRKKTVRDHYARMQLLTAETSSTTTDDLHEERIERLMTALGKLSPRTRYVITACFLEHKKYK